jgi:DNA-binding response OmpR family regulator
LIRILVIDDEPSVCAVVEKILAPSGYDVTTATGGRAGLEAAAKQFFSAAIVDICMRDVSGLDVIRALRAQAPGMGLIAMSGLLSESAGTGAPDFLGMAANLDGIPRLAKPFRPGELLDLVEQCCRLIAA